MVKPPFVYIAGAGPGSIGMLTLDVATLLMSGVADIVAHDRLIGDDILALIPEHTTRIYVGKKSGEHALPQSEINILLAEKALEGRIIIRLKGGDPFIFGRGGEEIAELEAHNVPYEIMPGITTAAAVAALCRFPLTHRNDAHSVRFATGHARNGRDPVLFPGDVVDLHTTLVIYMGTARITAIRNELIEKGYPASTPCLAVSRASLPGERRIKTSLADIPHRLEQEQLRSPCILVIGVMAGQACVGNSSDMLQSS